MEWLQACKDQAMIGCPSWNKLRSVVEEDLARKVKPQLNDISRRQVLIELLGPQFTKKYIPNQPGDPFPESTIKSSKKKEKLVQEMKSWLKKEMDKILRDKGLKDSNGQPQGELTSFMNQSGDIVSKNVKKQLRQGRNGNKGSSYKRSRGFQNSSEIIGMAMTSFIEDSPELVSDLTKSLKKYTIIFPHSLRPHLWRDYLITKETQKKKGKRHYQQIIDSFQKSLSISMKELKLTRVTRSSIWKQIDKEVLEIYHKTNNSTDEDITETAQLLNIIHIYNKSYHLYYIYWAIMIQQIFLHNNEFDKDEKLIITAKYLEILLRNFAPKPKVATDIASKVWERVGEEDKQLQNHISKCMKKNVIVHSEDFPHEIFNMSKNKTQMMFTETQENDIDDDLKSQKKIIEDPEIFIRKWLIEGFVSVLKPLAAMFVWDQLFLDEWNEKSLQHVCFVLLGLLKPWFFIAEDYRGVREVFIKESSLLYTIDIRQGWKHVLNGGKFQDLADMNRNINANFSEPPESPPPPPKPKPIPAPVPVPVPIPIPDPPPKSPEIRKEDCGNAWLPHKEQNSTTSRVPKLTDQFDFYIDSVRFTSDNSSIIKVTGKFLNLYLGEKYPKTPEILAFPKINSPARNPQFDFKLTINREKQVMNPDALVLLRVYTIERHTEQIVIIGSCLIDVFSNIRGKPVQVNVEGHQIRLHRGLPSPEINVRHLESKHMDDNPNIPCATVLVRFMAHDEQGIPAPSYDTRYYKSHLSCPNESEKRVYRHYINDPEYRMTLTELASKLQIINSSNDDKAVMDSMKKKLSQKKGLEIPELPFERFIKYDKKYGMMIVADKASALPVYLEGRFFQCLTQIYPGRNGGEQIQSFLTQKQDLKCVQRAPDWLDPPKVLKLYYDERTVLIISLYGIRPTYVPPRDGKDAYLTHRGGNELMFTMEHSVAWGVVQCFDKGGVLAGIHLTPLFKGRVPKNIIEEFQYSPIEDVIRKNMKNLRFLELASLEVTIWDGRFTSEDCPPLPVIKSYLRVTAHPQKYLKARVQRGGPPVQQLLLESLPSSIHKDSKEFEEHKSKFELLVQEKFNILMNKELKEAGFSPLI